MQKVILAFSGGLDTSFCVPYLIEQGYNVITVTVDTGGFSNKELREIAIKSKKLGASKHYQIDGKKSIFEKIISFIIKTNSLYENSYPNMCSDRYTITEEAVKIAKKENANVIAHGSSAMGNDQVRFDVALMSIAPEMKIVTPIREIGGSRKKEQEYLEKKGFPVTSLNKKYSVNQNILGITYSGSEIDQVQEPDESMFLWTKLTKKNSSYLKLEFKKGVPVALNNKNMFGAEILIKLNKIAGAYGFGRGYYTGNCVIGIKGHIAFEAPGILTLIQAHIALEQLVLTKTQYTIGKFISEQFTDLLYTGKFYDPSMKDIKSFIDSQQQYVSGSVILKLSPHQVQAVAVTSPFSLINPKIATYAQSSSWTANDAKGFIKLYGLQSKISAELKRKD
ncbi:MAG: argininosuccinate synthase [Patescibacteria group bacterium]|nr:argininosuccinate synthase [Patescibacteria group bacterium]